MTVGVTFLPADRRVEAVQKAMDLQPGCVVDFLTSYFSLGNDQVLGGSYSPYSTQIILAASFKDPHIKAVTHAMGGYRYTCETSTNNGNLRSTQDLIGLRRIRREKFV